MKFRAREREGEWQELLKSISWGLQDGPPESETLIKLGLAVGDGQVHIVYTYLATKPYCFFISSLTLFSGYSL